MINCEKFEVPLLLAGTFAIAELGGIEDISLALFARSCFDCLGIESTKITDILEDPLLNSLPLLELSEFDSDKYCFWMCWAAISLKYSFVSSTAPENNDNKDDHL